MNPKSVAMIHLEPITPENWRIPLHIAKEQEAHVASPEKILARAYAYREARSEAFLAYSDDAPVGMAMYHDCDPLQACVFSQFFIDERYQGQGYGTKAAQLVLALMQQDGKYSDVVLRYIESDTAARRLYEKLGFHPTGEQDEDEIVMRKTLWGYSK